MPPPRPPPASGANPGGPDRYNTSNVSSSAQRNGSTATNPSTVTKKRKHRGGKKRKNRRQSFAAPSETETATSNAGDVDVAGNHPGSRMHLPRDPLIEGQAANAVPSARAFYQNRVVGNRSDESLDSNALLDHRDQPSMRPRRESRIPNVGTAMTPRSAGSYFGLGAMGGGGRLGDATRRRTQSREQHHSDDNDEDDDDDMGREATDRTPLMAGLLSHRPPTETGYGIYQARSRGSSQSSGRRKENILSRSYPSHPDRDQEYDVNNPPSVPASPDLPAQGLEDVGGGPFLNRSPNSRRSLPDVARDALINIDEDDNGKDSDSGSGNFRPGNIQRHATVTLPVEEDVCFPAETISEIGDFEDFQGHNLTQTVSMRHRRRRRDWPLLWVLDEWAQQEKEELAQERRMKKVSEPMLIEGRLRPKSHVWHRMAEDAPYRYTYFNDEFESTIHAQTISELVQPGGSFRELFIPDPPLLEESSSDEDDEEQVASPKSQVNGPRESSNVVGRLNSLLGQDVRSESRAASVRAPSIRPSAHNSGDQTPQKLPQTGGGKPKKYGPRPTFWLDVQSPTEQEMRILCKAFGIHALTAEDIMMQEAREKVELFRHYYFINYRTFEQDTNSEDYLEPINMYVVVFRLGILTFHFSQIPHPANVRRRIRQLTDYLILSSDWISYAIIDDITDVYQPLIHNIEAEVDDIDELILKAFQDTRELVGEASSKDTSSNADEKSSPSGIDMLRRIGECRKKVMSLYRLLGNKADVIKGFAKRCNEQWEVAPKSEIGLYLGDIQDHILTMTSNLSHYETLLSRAHSNYLAQVSIRMNERQEQTSDVLGKLTVVGTIVLPMNIICGMWGMNVKVPGQDIDNLNWFWSITAGLILFAVVCYIFCKRVYGIV